MGNIKVIINYDVFKNALYTEEVVIIVEQIKELKSSELDPTYYIGEFELTCGLKIITEFYFNNETEKYEIRVNEKESEEN